MAKEKLVVGAEHHKLRTEHCILILAVLAVPLMAFIIKDPYKLGPLSSYDFIPVKHDIAPYREVMQRCPRDSQSRLRLGKVEFVNEIFGPESLEFDPQGQGPYAGLADGRVVRWMGESAGWETFALVSPTWSSEECANGENSTSKKQHGKEKQCGRPLGLRFNKDTGELYIADAYFGLMLVGPEGGLAAPLATHAEGTPILFANDLDIHRNGSVFFTDTSARYTRKDHFIILLEAEATGRLLRYDPLSKTTHVVLKDLAFPNGVQLSKDQTFLLFTETTNCRIMRYWLEGSNTGKMEVFSNLPGFPDNVRLNEKGQFWVAIDCCRTATAEILSYRPWLRSIYFKLPLKLNYLAKAVGMEMYTVVSLLNEDGEVMEVLEDRRGEVIKLVSEVREVNGKLWFGTVAHNHIGVFDLDHTK